MTAINTSYIFGEDIEGGWGSRYFFTFYSQFGVADWATDLEVAALSTAFLLSIILNSGVGWGVIFFKEMRTVTNCFLLNLTMADLMFALGIPFVIITRINENWVLGDVLCRILPYSQFVCGFVLLWTLTFISVDRYHCIVVPPFRSKLTPKRAANLTLGTWLIPIVLFLPVVFWFREKKFENGFTICTLVFPRVDIVNLSLCFTVFVIVFTSLLPIGLVIFFYHKIFRKLIETKNRWIRTLHIVESPETNVTCMNLMRDCLRPWCRRSTNRDEDGNTPRSSQAELRLKRHYKVIRVLLFNVIAVLFMWLPITILMFLIYLDGNRPNDDINFFLRSHHFLWALFLALFNTVVNPILYGILSENFRVCFTKLIDSARKSEPNEAGESLEMLDIGPGHLRTSTVTEHNVSSQAL